MDALEGTTTQILWDQVVGDVLEELLYGLLEAMDASALVWRAGADQGGTASDGGRDLEATFSHPTPDGDVEVQRWWVESKGRGGVVPKTEVQSAIHNAAGRTDLDVLVICTNSRFTNPTRDWVSDWESTHSSPKVRLWDRDKLTSLVRRYPVVAARVLPNALTDGARLGMLVERFFRLGEEPTEGDRTHFFDRLDVVKHHPRFPECVVMFAYADGMHEHRTRPWAKLLEDAPAEQVAEALVHSLIGLPRMCVAEIPRRLSGPRMIEASAYVLIAALARLDPRIATPVLQNPWAFVSEQSGRLGSEPGLAERWFEAFTLPILRQAVGELADVCADDCVRVTTDIRSIPIPLQGQEYWRRFGVGSDEGEGRWILTMEGTEPCAVGLELTREKGCPLLRDELAVDEADVGELQRVIRFRMKHPTGQYSRLKDTLNPKVLEAGLEYLREDLEG